MCYDEKTYARMCYDEKTYVRQLEKAGEFLIKHAADIAKNHKSSDEICVKIVCDGEEISINFEHKFLLK